jgi:anti-sigma factor RsiW
VGIFKARQASENSGILQAMPAPLCLLYRPRLERYVDRALNPRSTRAVEAHLGGCLDCRGRVENQTQLKSLVRSAIVDPSEPDWEVFWPQIEARLSRERPRPMKDPWWAPLWKPFWGHPRLALGGAMAATLALAFSLWPGSEVQGPGTAWAADPVVVQDVGTPDPERTVMVYSTPDQVLTVIWLIPLDSASDES